MIKIIKCKDNETIEQFMHRLSAEKTTLKLSWQDISDLLFENYGKRVTKDYVRHECYGMRKREVVDFQHEEEFVKILIMNDLHLPHERADVLEIIKSNKDVDFIIIGGDLVDCKSCSFFDDFNKGSVEEELAYTHEFFTKVNEIINPEKTQIIAIRGNHEYRYTKDIMRMQEKQLQKLLNPKLLSMLESGFTVYENNKDIYYKPIENFKYHDDFYIRLFDNLIVAHPLDFSGVEGTISLKVADYFLNEGIAEKGDVLVYGHTHKQSAITINRRQGLYVVENGCLCKPHEYSKMGKLSFTPQNYGYCKIKFKENEKIDLNNIQFIHIK